MPDEPSPLRWTRRGQSWSGYGYRSVADLVSSRLEVTYEGKLAHSVAPSPPVCSVTSSVLSDALNIQEPGCVVVSIRHETREQKSNSTPKPSTADCLTERRARWCGPRRSRSNFLWYPYEGVPRAQESSPWFLNKAAEAEREGCTYRRENQCVVKRLVVKRTGGTLAHTVDCGGVGRMRGVGMGGVGTRVSGRVRSVGTRV